MKRIKKRFTPLGFDHITLACYDREFWGKKLEWLGFKRITAQENADDPFSKDDYDTFLGSAFSLGRVRIFLVDSATVRLGKNYVEWFLKTYGNMQVLEVGVEVDSVDEAFREFHERGMSLTTPIAEKKDAFGRCRVTEITTPLSRSFQWQLIERKNRETLEKAYRKSLRYSSPDTLFQSGGIDHVAIAVRNLDQWVAFYTALGFDVVYTPYMQKDGLIKGEEGLIEGTESAMRTYALRRGAWIVALVEGVDRARMSQVTTYVDMHGDHSAHHAALLFPGLAHVVRALRAQGAQFRFSRVPKEGEEISLDHILHLGEDDLGQLLQCFTKPLDRKWVDDLNPRDGKGGFFFELIQRLVQSVKNKKNGQAFYDPTVVGLFESIEREIKRGDLGLVFPEESEN